MVPPVAAHFLSGVRRIAVGYRHIKIPTHLHHPWRFNEESHDYLFTTCTGRKMH